MRKPSENRVLLVLFSALLATTAFASDFYVAPTGSSSGNGSKEKPWDLATALAQPSAVKPGDTIWLRGGTYVGHFTSTLVGTKSKPIVVRQYSGERATIDGNYGGNEVNFYVKGSYAWFWGFELTNSDPTRTSPTADNPTRRGEAVFLLGPGTKLINAIVHDAVQGVLTSAPAPDAEVYGSLIYYNGYDGSDRGHGHGIYLQNETGAKRIVDNILFGQFGYGIHGYTEGGKLDNLYLEGNTSFNNGGLSKVSGLTTDILVGASGSPASSAGASGKVAKNTSLRDNYTYFSTPGGTALNLGYSKGIASPAVINNYFVGGTALALINAFRPITMTGNTLYGTISGFSSTEFPSNTYPSSRPTGVKVFVRPNQYEPGRANITIYNWDRVENVDVSLNGVLNPGTAYELRDAQNYFGPPVLSGTYDGGSLHIPMNGHSPAAPVGLPAPAATGPDFEVFVVVPKAPVSNAKPPVAAFSYGPRSPVTGMAVAFLDRSAGTATSRSWDFGDPAAGAANVSSLEGPTHSYSATGTYTVRLSIANDGGTSVRTRNVTVSESPGTRTAALPVAGHVLGATGTTFLTDVAIENPTAQPISADLVFSPGGGAPPLRQSLSLGAGEMQNIADVVGSRFGLTNAIGSLGIETSGDPPAPLRVAARTYVQQASGTLGLGAVGLSSTENATSARYLSNLSVTGDFRTNVGILNIADAAQTYSLELLSANGSVLGSTVLAVNAGEQRQWGLAQLFPAVSATGLTARIAAATGALAPLAYASVVDNASSDPTQYPAAGPAPVQYVPGIANVSGVGGALFLSEISVANSGKGPTTVTLTFLEHDRDNTSAPTVSFVLAPQETFHADDALSTLFGVTETYGALKVEADSSPGVAVFERILTDATTTAGTVGQQMDAISVEDQASAGAVLGLRQDGAFRSNIGLLNPNATAATVSLTLLRSPAVVLGTASIFLPPRGYVQRNLAALIPSVSLPAGEILSVVVDSGTLPVTAFASVIDNVSQDPTFYPEQP